MTNKINADLISLGLTQLGLLDAKSVYHLVKIKSRYDKFMEWITEIQNNILGQKPDPNRHKEKRNIVLFSIRIDPHKIDEFAEKNRIMGNLSHIESDLAMKTPFKKKFKSQFNMFDSRERIEAIIGILNQQFDFPNLMKQGIIIDHYPLHKRRIKDINDEFEKDRY